MGGGKSAVGGGGANSGGGGSTKGGCQNFKIQKRNSFK